MPKLTAAAVERIRPDPGKRIEVPDAIVVGLYLQIQPSGRRSWAIRYRHQGRPRKHTLGSHPAMDLAQARDAARQALDQVARGGDPAGDKQAARAAPPPPAAVKEPDTVARIAGLYIEQYCKRHQRSWRETERVLRREILPLWGDRLFVEISRADVNELLRAIVERGSPYMSNRTLAYLSRLWGWAVDEGYAETSPCDRVKKKGPEKKRDRILTDSEIGICWAAWERQGWPFGALQRLLLTSGQRLAEVAGARWDEIDLDERLWTLPRGRTKADRAHNVPLSPLALEIIGTLPRFAGCPFLFPAQRARKASPGLTAAEVRRSGAVAGFSKAKAQCDRLLAAAGHEMPAWRWHDLRRTCRSNLSRLRVPDHVAELTIGHAVQGLRSVYDRFAYLDERRAALDAWGNLLSSIVTGAAPDNVVRLHR